MSPEMLPKSFGTFEKQAPGYHRGNISCHVKMAFETSIIWFLLSQFSQSTLNRRNGSNACTFIALLLAKFYFLHKSALSLSKYMSLLLNWINLLSAFLLENTSMTVLLQELGNTSVSKRQLLFWVLLLAMYNLKTPLTYPS